MITPFLLVWDASLDCEKFQNCYFKFPFFFINGFHMRFLEHLHPYFSSRCENNNSLKYNIIIKVDVKIIRV